MIRCYRCHLEKPEADCTKQGKLLKSCNSCRGWTEKVETIDKERESAHRRLYTLEAELSVARGVIDTLRDRLVNLDSTYHRLLARYDQIESDYLDLLSETASNQRDFDREQRLAICNRLKIVRNRKAFACCICSDNVQVDDRVCILSCAHRFDAHCLIRYLFAANGEKPSCPLCRASI